MKDIFISKSVSFLKQNFFLLTLFVLAFVVLFTAIKINIFRYNNFDYGKFDLGNMTQMVWYTLQGKPLYLTGYFGENFPRWAMSHVDPILLLFVPIFAVFPHPLTLVFSQLVLLVCSSFLVFAIANLHLKNKLAATLVGMSFLAYPALGFVMAWTGFHGVSAVVPFFLAAFYIYDRMYINSNFTKSGMVWFWAFLILTMTGKEQLPTYVGFMGLFIMFFRHTDSLETFTKGTFMVWFKNYLRRSNVKLGLSMILVSMVWFVLAFFVIIPHYSALRVAGFNDFAAALKIDPESVTNVSGANYFISRYEAFGDTYFEVAFGMLSNPDELARVVFGGDKPENMRQTFEPVLYLPLLHPATLLMAIPDLLINYGTSAGGIGTAEIINHRISMIIPVLFISSILAIKWLAILLSRFLRIRRSYIVVVLCALFLFQNVKTSFDYQNPIYMWLSQAITKKLKVIPVFAKTAPDVAFRDDIEIGERFKLSKLDTKDRDCAKKIVEIIPDKASVSGPDYLGAHLSMRETYAIFPVLFNQADYVIVDVFSQKILRILDLDVTLVRNVVESVLREMDYELSLGCGNLFVFEKIGPHNKNLRLPLQERFSYDEQIDLEIFLSLTIVDMKMPQSFTRGSVEDVQFVYVKREEETLPQYVLFMSFVNSETGDLYQVANLPSFAINEVENWREDRYYIEDLEIALPEFLDPGQYKVFIGMSNEIRTRSIYLGDVEVL